MFSIVAWFGNLAASFTASSRLAPNQLSVCAKLNNKFLGVVENPFSRGIFTRTSTYKAMTDLQNQVSHLLKHEYLPSRYLVVYVGEVRLTKPDFPFTGLKDQDHAQVVSTLQHAPSISVVYHLDRASAEDSLRARGLVSETYTYSTGDNLHVLWFDATTAPPQQNVLAVPELDFWAFDGCVNQLVFYFEADMLGCLDCFPQLTGLATHKQLCRVKQVNFKSLATTCKMLRQLYLRLEVSSRALDGIGELCNLTSLCLEILTPRNALCVKPCLTIPTEVARLGELEDLSISGRQVGGLIPKELGRLTKLTHLSLRGTQLCSVPTELGLLTNLRHLDLRDNPDLCGNIPRELQTIGTTLLLTGTPHVRLAPKALE